MIKYNVRDLIYLNTRGYMSLDNLRVFYWAIIIIPIIMVTWGIAAINTVGVNLRSLFPLISIGIWSLFYWLFVLIIQSPKVKKTFELRFLVNGISGFLISSLFWILYASLSLLDNNQIIGFDFSLWILFFYLLFSAFYIGLIVLGVRKGIFKKIKGKSQNPKALAISAFFSAILPSAGVMGMYTSRMLRAHASDAVQNIVGTVALVLLIFAPILAHINFVQYYYCKKYEILCDEYGDTTSPNLERKTKEKKTKNKPHDANSSATVITKKKLPLIFKILIGIVAVPIAFFVIVFLVFFIKGFINGIS